jgi:hypothetical protein
MGIIKDILKEEIARNKDWVSFIKLLDDGGYKDSLIPHRIVSNVIQYDLKGYRLVYESGRELRGVINDIEQYLFRKNKTGLIKFLFIAMQRYQNINNKMEEKLWFDMNVDIKFDMVGVGSYNYAHDIGDKVRKVEFNKDNNTDLYELLPYLSEKYPEYFVKTIKTKSGYIQDKVKVIDKKDITTFGVISTCYGLDVTDMYNFEPIKEYIIENYPDDSDRLIKLLSDIRNLRYMVYDIRQNDEYIENFNSWGMVDFHLGNVGYDKDGKLKMFDI